MTSEKSLKDYIHLYTGCLVYAFSGNDKMGDPFILDHIILTNYDRVPNGIFADIKPLLRNWISLENFEIFKLVKEKFGYDKIVILRITDTEINFKGVKEINDRMVETDCTQTITSLSAEQFRYLLSLGIDLFDLIKNGLAIAKPANHIRPHNQLNFPS